MANDHDDAANWEDNRPICENIWNILLQTRQKDYPYFTSTEWSKAIATLLDDWTLIFTEKQLLFHSILNSHQTPHRREDTIEKCCWMNYCKNRLDSSQWTRLSMLIYHMTHSYKI